MTPTQQLWAWLEPLIRSDGRVAYTLMSDAERLDRWYQDSRSELTYPGVFVFRPRYRAEGQFNVIMEIVFVVMVLGDLDDYASQDKAYTVAEDIGNGIVQRVNHTAKKHENGIAGFELNLRVEPIIYEMIDRAWGYEFTLGTLEIAANDTYC